LDTVVEANDEADYEDEDFMSFVEEIENNGSSDDAVSYYNCSVIDKDTDNLKPYFSTSEYAKDFYENEGWETEKEYDSLVDELINYYSGDPDW
jgi:hypothetical protein